MISVVSKTPHNLFFISFLKNDLSRVSRRLNQSVGFSIFRFRIDDVSYIYTKVNKTWCALVALAAKEINSDSDKFNTREAYNWTSHV